MGGDFQGLSMVGNLLPQYFFADAPPGPNVADFWEMSFGVFCRFQGQKGDFYGVLSVFLIFAKFSMKMINFHPKNCPAGHYFTDS